MRATLGICFAVAALGCTTRPVDLGGGDASPVGTAVPEAGAPDALVAEAAAPLGDDAGAVTPDLGPVTIPVANATITTCTTTSSMSATLGYGFSYDPPAACGAPAGSSQPVAGIDDVKALLVGFWYDCTHQSFGIDFGEAEKAIQLTSDGRYIGHGGDDDWTLVPLTSVPGDPHLDASSAATPAASGTWTVVDGSASYGPGTYELQLRPAIGGLFKGQVKVTGSPTQLLFFPTNADEQVFTPPLPWSPRKGVCGCMSTAETPAFEDDAVGLGNAIVGKWMWCDGGAPPLGSNIGVEFATGNAWYPLDEDQAGNVTRGAGGTFTIVPSPPQSSPPSPFGGGPEPLTIQLDGPQPSSTQVLYYPDPRVLLVSVGTSLSNAQLTAGDGPSNIYATCFPMP